MPSPTPPTVAAERRPSVLSEEDRAVVESIAAQAPTLTPAQSSSLRDLLRAGAR